MQETTKQALTAASAGAVLGGVAAVGASAYCTSQGAGALAGQCGQIAEVAVTTAAGAAAALIGTLAGLGILAWERLRSRF